MRVRRNPYVLYSLSLQMILAVRYSGGGIFLWALYNVLFFIAVPFVVSSLLGFSPKELGLSRGGGRGYRWALILFIATVPLSLYGTTIPAMKDYYPIFSFSSPFDFALKELAMGAIMLANEAFYRGFLLMPLSRKNRWLAILAQDVPYTLAHIGKPGIEVPYSFIAGIVFSWLDLESESVLPSFLLHWLGSAFFDVLCAFS